MQVVVLRIMILNTILKMAIAGPKTFKNHAKRPHTCKKHQKHLKFRNFQNAKILIFFQEGAIRRLLFLIFAAEAAAA